MHAANSNVRASFEIRHSMFDIQFKIISNFQHRISLPDGLALPTACAKAIAVAQAAT